MLTGYYRLSLAPSDQSKGNFSVERTELVDPADKVVVLESARIGGSLKLSSDARCKLVNLPSCFQSFFHRTRYISVICL